MISIILAAFVAAVPAPVHGDFDHDGKADVAELRAGADGRYDLVVQRGVRGAPAIVLQSMRGEDVWRFYVAVEKPGRLQTACGKGHGPASAPCPRDYVVLTGDTLSFGTMEASMAVAVWTGKAFEVVWISD